jgi:hypothetical protein
MFFLQPAWGEGIIFPFQFVPQANCFQSPQLTIDSAEYDTLILRISAKEGGTARLFWINHYDPQFNQPKSIAFFLRKGTHDYMFNIASQNPNWIGWVKGVLVFPEFDHRLVEVKGAEIITGNFLTNIRSGWQEFWGPRGRTVIGSTINTIQSTNLFGRSIMFYIYWFLAIWALGCTTFLFIQHKFNWQKLGKLVVFAALACWLLLEISSLFNNWLMFKSDLKYFGKSSRDKLIMANTGDFYPFIEFCRSNIPIDAKFDIRIPPIYNDIKAVYYLYPRERSTLEADYLVVYDQPSGSNFTAWNTFRPGALIMRLQR